MADTASSRHSYFAQVAGNEYFCPPVRIIKVMSVIHMGFDSSAGGTHPAHRAEISPDPGPQVGQRLQEPPCSASRWLKAPENIPQCCPAICRARSAARGQQRAAILSRVRLLPSAFCNLPGTAGSSRWAIDLDGSGGGSAEVGLLAGRHSPQQWGCYPAGGRTWARPGASVDHGHALCGQCRGPGPAGVVAYFKVIRVFTE
jgi:hypothetical protein